MIKLHKNKVEYLHKRGGGTLICWGIFIDLGKKQLTEEQKDGWLVYEDGHYKVITDDAKSTRT